MNLRTADRLFSQLIRARGFCQRCGTTSNLEACHVIGRRFFATRWDPENAFCACHECHAYLHAHPDVLKAWIGEDEYSRLHLKAVQIVRVDLSEVLRDLRVRLKAVAV